MKSYFAEQALLPAGWAGSVRISIEDGSFVEALPDVSPGGAERLAGPALPGMANLHSHAFQRAMAGLAETRPGSTAGDLRRPSSLPGLQQARPRRFPQQPFA